MDLAKFVKSQRRENGWSKGELAEKIHVSEVLIGMWEHGKRTGVTLAVAYRLAQVFHMTLDDLAEAILSDKQKAGIAQSTGKRRIRQY